MPSPGDLPPPAGGRITDSRLPWPDLRRHTDSRLPWPALLLPCLLLLGHATLGLAFGHGSKSVNVAVQAKWPGTPLAMEAGELVAKYGRDLFWPFVDRWTSAGALPDPATQRGCVDRILGVAAGILDGPLQPVLHFSLLLRSASPQLLVYRQLAQESLSSHSLQAPPCKEHPTSDHRSTSGPRPPQNKCCWVDVGTHAILDEAELLDWLQAVEEKAPMGGTGPELYDFDHIYPGSPGVAPVAILYGAFGTSCFSKFHISLSEAASQGHVAYILRPVLATGCEGVVDKCSVLGSGGVLNLGGYGVELALKNMEYKAIDDSDLKKAETPDDSRADDASEEIRGFIFSKLLERKPELADDLMNFRDHLLSSSVSDTLNVWELKDLGYQTAQRILQATDPLQSMQDINQNFPNLVSSISRLRLNETIKDEIVSNQRLLSPGKNLFAINGALINIDNLDLYSLIDIVLGELLLADSIFKLKVPSRFTKDFMQIPDPSELSTFRVDFRSDHVHYLNNLEEDATYKRWRSNVQELLMPVFPGQLRYIRKNLFHAVYIIDPAVASDLKIIDTIMYYHENMVPMRFGIILMSDKMTNSIADNGGELPPGALGNEDQSDVSILIIRLFLYAKENYGVRSAFRFLSHVYEALNADEGHAGELVDMTHAEEAFFEVAKQKAKVIPGELLQKLKKGSEYKEQALQSSLFVYSLGLFVLRPCLLMNGLVYGPSELQEGAIKAMNEELPRIQEGVYYGHISSRTDVLDKFLKESGYSRYNPQITASTKEQQKYVSLAGALTSSNSIFTWLGFLHSSGTEDELKPITHLLSVDILCKHGFELLQQAIRYLIKGTEKGRVGVLFNVPNVSDQNSLHFAFIRIFLKAMTLPSRSRKILPFLQDFLSWYKSHIFSAPKGCEPTPLELVENATKLAGASGLKLLLSEIWLTDKSEINSASKQITECSNFLSTHIGLKAGLNAVVTNGKVFVQKDVQFFVAEDFSLLENVEYERRVKAVAEILEKVEWEKVEPDDLTSDFLSNAIMAISSAITLRARSSDTARFDLLQSTYSAILRQSESATVHVDAVIDPLSTTGQKLTPLLLLLQQWFKASMQILLNPMNSLADLPLKNFYRYVSPGKNAFTPDGDLLSGPTATFSNLPPSRTLTMNLDVPEAWLIEPVKAIYDLDNIVLEKLGSVRTMFAVFELEALVLTGHCYEKNSNPPRGLQLLLGTKLQPHMVDTIVMANLGYWQLKAAPGVWSLSLAPGRSSELYTLQGFEEGTENGPMSKGVVIKDLGGELVRLEVVKKKGKEDQSILGSGEDIHDDDASYNKKKGKVGWNKNLLKWASDLLGGGKQSEDPHQQPRSNGKVMERQGETINIFSIASGHLYERFLKIMMLSVLKNTRRPVKFWFIKNYLSPQFKDLIPHMAKEYGFECDLVTYKWPTWLHKQTEKQRIIWAYKILFLDVIFPLSLEKVIFVDADQIVRADMGDLYDMDLKGKPLAYTPFCDNNKEMDGYRFWNQGFWKEHLRGKPYHISALYVVDLVKLRQMAAGDTLRVFYETLSKDPGSLSNLDQDLPNYAQHTVPIFSLPQEWLWCESWCGNATKAKAKTIDLCNNPMTKEPKLQGARRIVPEWSSLDEEARESTSRILGDESDVSPAHGEAVESSGFVGSLSSRMSDAEEAAEL